VPIESARAIEATLGRTAFEAPMHAAPLPASPSAPASAGEALPPGATMPPTSALPTPVDSPGFASALGVHVSLLARGGVQEAELHLNPADMGPVSIRIQLDGTEAQVQFGADLAQTRQAIEAGLPELASALRDAGFTLAGGGVSAHAGQRGHDDAPPLPTGAESAGAADGEAPGAQIGRAIRRVAEGGLDLYA
jgi:flagellar hook-length control protein FliK